jgi:hypothetical protein
MTQVTAQSADMKASDVDGAAAVTSRAVSRRMRGAVLSGCEYSSTAMKRNMSKGYVYVKYISMKMLQTYG